MATLATVETRSPELRQGSGRWWGVAAAMFAIAWGGNEFTPLLVMYKAMDYPSPRWICCCSTTCSVSCPRCFVARNYRD